MDHRNIDPILQRYVLVFPGGVSRTTRNHSGVSADLSTKYIEITFEGNNSPLLATFTRRVQYVSGADLVYLFDRPWKDRLWTYQEILLASYPVIVCGTEHVQWSDFEWTFLFLRSSFRHFPRAAVAWEAIVFDRGQLQSFNRPTERSVLHTLQEHETIVRKIILTRRWLLSTAIGLLLAYTTTTLLVGVVSVCSRKYPEWRFRFVLERKTENAFMYIGIFGVFLCIMFICFELRPEYQTYRGDIKETASDDLVGALYQRAATDPRDMAYGIWAILRKRGASDLSEPMDDVAKEAQIPLLYRQLTIHLLLTTGNLRFLHIAAARRLPGTPSWIPDWSTFNSNTWRDVPGYPGTDLHGIAARHPPGSEDRLRMLRARQNLSIDSTQSVLTLLAREAGTVRGCVSFYAIKAIPLETDNLRPSKWNSLCHHLLGGFRHRSCRLYRGIETDERRAHTENLRSMLQWADWAQTIGCKIHATFYTQPTLQELFPISANATWPSQKDRTNWGKTLSGSRRHKLEGYLTLWMDGTKTPRWFHKFMATQNCLCTFIAELERKICYVSSLVNPGTFCLLACSDKTKVDDRALLVCGLPGWIIVRKREESDNAIDIISPQILQGIAANGKTRNLINRDDAALDDLFVEYHFH